MAGAPDNSINWTSLVDFLQPTLFKKHGKFREQFESGDLPGEINSDFDLEKIWDGKGRLDWIKVIKKNPVLEDCIGACKGRFAGKYNSEWLTKYHALYYSIKDDGYLERGAPITTIRFGEGSYYRMDGTHRSSVLFDLGYSKVRVMVFNFDDIRNTNPKINSLYEEWVLSNYRNYQKTDLSGESRIDDRYSNLIELTREYFAGKIVGDVGCNAGYFSILLSNDEAAEVKGFDIHEMDLAAAEIFANRHCKDRSKLSFYRGHVSDNHGSLLSCDVVFFIRSIYHLGKDSDLLIKTMKRGATVIIECNKGHKAKLPNPDEVSPVPGKRLALKMNLIPFLEQRGFEIVDVLKNVDDVVIATRV